MLVASPAVDENLRPGRHTRIATGTTHEDPMHLQGSCRCGAVGFSCDVYAPMPFLRCYCSICRKTAGGGGHAVNLGAWADSLKVEGERHVVVWHATIDGRRSAVARRFCGSCGTALERKSVVSGKTVSVRGDLVFLSSL